MSKSGRLKEGMRQLSTQKNRASNDDIELSGRDSFNDLGAPIPAQKSGEVDPPKPMSFFDKCLTVREDETEWRNVNLRFQSSTEPAPGQLGSLDNSIKTSKYATDLMC